MFTNAKIAATSTNPLDYVRQNGERGTPAFEMSSSGLRGFGSCPSRWMAGYEQPDSEAKEWGRLLDCISLTPDQFGNRYAVEPETYTETGMKCPVCESVTDSKKCAKCKTERIAVEVVKPWRYGATVTEAWRAAKIAEGREVVSRTDSGNANVAASRLGADEIAKAFSDASDKQVWLSATWTDTDTGLAIPVKCLIDYAPRLDTEFAKCLGDLKSTRNASLLPWQRWCFSAGYHVQAAFDLDMYVAATGEDRNTWCFILQENFPPWEPARRMLSQDFLTLGRGEYQRLLANYCQCLKSGKWPNYDEHDEAIQGWSLVDAEPFMAERAAFAPKFDFADEQETEPTPEPSDDLVP